MRPNVVFIVGDAMQRAHIGCYNSSKQTSPNMDELVDMGVLFENVFCCSNHTDSSITSMMTGKYPVSHGIMHHGKRVVADEVEKLDTIGVRFLAEVLKANGYKTIGFDWLGRWHARGYDFFGETMFGTEEDRIEKLIQSMGLSEVDEKDLRIFFHKKGVHLPGRSGVYYTRQAIQYIKNNPNENFFLFIHNWDTHTPFDIIPDSYKDMFYDGSKTKTVREMLSRIENDEWRRIVKDYHLYGVEYLDEILPLYDAGVKLFDDSLGELIEGLKEIGQFENTIFIITSDHGDNPLIDDIFVGHFGLYDPVIHVPLVMAGPGIPSGGRVREFVQHCDLFPTIMELLQISSQNLSFDGKTLLPLIKGNVGAIREFTLTSDGAAHKRFALRDKKYKYIYSYTANDPLIPFDTIGSRFKEELYDLENDPNERNNLTVNNSDTARNFKEKLICYVKSLEDEMNLSNSSRDGQSGKLDEKIIYSIDI